MTDSELLVYMGTDAVKWAAEFCKIARDKGHDLDEGWVFGWFANAIAAGRDVGRPDSLPKQRRWSFLRKLTVLKSLETGRVTEEEICKFHSLSPEELAEWRTAFEARGLEGLKITKRRARRSQCP